MRTYLKLFCGLVLVAAVLALPADPRPAIVDSDEINTDIERVPVRPFYGGLFEDVFERMRQQMLYLLSAVPTFGHPEGGNTTSVTKIIDGHKVTINETVYTSGNGENVASVVKVRVVDVRPQDEDGVTEADDSVETVEQSNENEIYSKNPQTLKSHTMEAFDMVANAGLEYPSDDEGHRERLRSVETVEDFGNGIDDVRETFDEPDNPNLETFDDNIESFEYAGANDYSIEDNEIGENGYRRQSLAGDTRVNDFAKGPTNPDAEIISFPNPPRDLSRDTDINAHAASEGRTPHPDVEFLPRMGIDVNEDTDVPEDRRYSAMNPGYAPYIPNYLNSVDNAPNSRYYYRTESK